MKGSVLPRGNRDKPGFNSLSAIHPALFVGNEIAAAFAPPNFFGCVVSTVPPLDRNFSRDRSLSSHKIYFLDEMGRESIAKEGHARECILQGARILNEALAAGKPTLVHCAYGQNRSAAICCAYAILYQGWTADDVNAYVVHQNRTCRQYYGQSPCSNEVFNRLLKHLAESQPNSRQSSFTTKKLRVNLLTTWLGLASYASAAGSSALMRRQSTSTTPSPPKDRAEESQTPPLPLQLRVIRSTSADQVRASEGSEFDGAAFHRISFLPKNDLSRVF